MMWWKSCSYICTDGAAATISVNGLFGEVKKVNPNIKCLHCEALTSKRQPWCNRSYERRWYILSNSGHWITDHEQLLLHTVWKRYWKFAVKFLWRSFASFTVFENATCVAQLAYLADVFTKLNKLNLSLQGNHKSWKCMTKRFCMIHKNFTVGEEMWWGWC